MALFDDEILARIETSRNEIPHPSLPKGSSIYGSTKIFPDIQAEPGQSYLTLVHGIAHESSVSFVACLQATKLTLVHGIAHESSVSFVACLQALRALRKGFDSVLYFYGPGAMNVIANRGFPTTGDSAFPGEQNINSTVATFLEEGGTAFVCRFGLSLHGIREEDVMAGVIPCHPLDVQDALIYFANKGAIINSTYMV